MNTLSCSFSDDSMLLRTCRRINLDIPNLGVQQMYADSFMQAMAMSTLSCSFSDHSMLLRICRQ
jgi:hypothetical protein